MFFGRNKSNEEISESGLVEALNQSFNKKLSGLDAKAARFSEGIERSKVELERACDQFASLQKDPDTDFIRASSATYVKEQKTAYTNLMRRILASHSRATEAGTLYDRYYAGVKDTESLMNEVLRANSSFKMVLDAYPNDLGTFKRAFSALENNWRALRFEVDARNGEMREYSLITGHIKSLYALADELGSVESGIEEMANAASRKIDAEEISRIEQKVASIKVQGREMERRIETLNAEMSMMLGTIDKPARKHDYLSMYKPKLTPLIASPAMLAQEQKYDEFYGQVGEMKEEIEKGTISVKNESEVMGAIGLILGGRIRGIMEERSKIGAEKLPLESEMRDLERMLGELNGMVHGASQREATLSHMRKRVEDIAKEQVDLRGKIELLFHSYYKRRIKITEKKE